MDNTNSSQPLIPKLIYTHNRLQPMQSHWDRVYDGKDITKLGWYQRKPQPSIELIGSLNLDKKSRIFIAGAGATTLVDHLLQEGYNSITACDISKKALDHLKARVGEDNVNYIVDDLTCMNHSVNDIDLWYDRAVLHFLTEEEKRMAYWEHMDNAVKNGGHVIIAAFSTEGARKCSGLDVHRYNKDMLVEFMGEKYELLKAFDHMYTMPSGDKRPYVYTLFRKR